MHESVLPQESIHALAVVPDGVYVDATFGRGGHSRAILERLGPTGRLLVFDRDPQAFAQGEPTVLTDPRVQIFPRAFDTLFPALSDAGYAGHVNGILFDLGISSPQVDDPKRGFSFMRTGPLDMRMDPRMGPTLADRLQHSSEQELMMVIRTYGQERYAGRIARAIWHAWLQQTLPHTEALAETVAAAHPAWVKGQHPATRTFQALRMWVNDEEGQLKRALGDLHQVLAPRGRVVIIAFHSLEDSWVKAWGIQQSHDPRYPPDIPLPQDQLHPPFRPVVRLVRPSAAEVARNPRARSARLRAWEKNP